MSSRASGQSAFAELGRRASRYAREHRGRLAIALVLAAVPPLAVGIAVAGTTRLYESSARLDAAPGSVLRALNRPLGLPDSPAHQGGARLADLGDVAFVRSTVLGGAWVNAANSSISLRIDPVSGDVIVTARSPDRRQSRQLARRFGETLVTFRNGLLEQTLTGAREELLVRKRLAVSTPASTARVRVLSQKVATLRSLAPDGSAGVAVAQGPRRVRSAGPYPGRDIFAALVLGLLLGVTLLALPELRGRRRAAAGPAT